MKVFHFLIIFRCQKILLVALNWLLKANTLNRWISQSPPLLPMKSHWSCELFPLVYQHKTLTFNGARFGLLASRHLRVNNNILLSLTGILSSPRNIDRSRADTGRFLHFAVQCGNFSLASPEAFKGRESTAMETDIPMIEVLQPVDLTNNLRLFPLSRSERSFVPP